mmetsp:Transcript_2263/g.3900  ORF Transcript_2263/g.3900 Transcript_2263/m.3900 type:complete len:149 (-) Transcript_2263:230-676(-)
MKIFVRTLNGTTIDLEVDESDTVDVLKQMIEDRVGVPPEQQRLLGVRGQLESGRALEDYNLQHESLVHLVQYSDSGSAQAAVREERGGELSMTCAAQRCSALPRGRAEQRCAAQVMESSPPRSSRTAACAEPESEYCTRCTSDSCCRL